MNEQAFEQVRDAMLPTDEELLEFFSSHVPNGGIMASPNHWAYRGDWRKPEWPRDENETPGEWFAYCGGNGTLTHGCGWDSKPNTFETKEEAHSAALQHLVDEAKKAFFKN